MTLLTCKWGEFLVKRQFKKLEELYETYDVNNDVQHERNCHNTILHLMTHMNFFYSSTYP
jgi:hypothetical protein